MRKSFSTCCVAAVLSAVSLLGCAHRAVKPSKVGEEYTVRFAVIGDRTGGHEPGIYGQIVGEIERMKPDFVLSVGDMIEGYTGDTVTVKGEWKEYKELLEPLTMPIYLVPGNHDIWDSVSLELYRRHVGEPYYSTDVEGMHFIFLDNSRYYTADALPSGQVDWLIADLEKNVKAQKTFVIFHIPYWIETVAAGEPDTLHTLFVKYGVDGVFTGHYHSYFSGEFDGVVYTGVGSSGGGCSLGPTGLKYHFMWVTVDGDEISMVPIKMGGVLRWDEVTAAEYRFIGKAEGEAIRLTKVSVNEDLTVPDTDMTVTIRNLNSDILLADTLRWEAPVGWSVIPDDLPVEIGALETYAADFTVRSTGGLYPTPALSLQYPYGEGKTFEMEKALQVSRTVYASQADTPPVIDGDLSENTWSNAVTKFFAPDGSPMLTDPVSFYFAWDEENLYIAAKCVETRMDSMFADATEHDGAVYGEDCVGYFLQPDVADGPVYQIYFNPLGTAFDQKISVEEEVAVDADREWNGSYNVKTAKGKDYWSIEAQIPLKELDTEGESGKTWAVNFRRKQRRLNSSADWQAPISYNPRDYGILLLK